MEWVENQVSTSRELYRYVPVDIEEDHHEEGVDEAELAKDAAQVAEGQGQEGNVHVGEVHHRVVPPKVHLHC